MLTILAAGNDAPLLATRAAVLRRASPNVTAHNSGAALELLQSRRFDLVVLCHTLSAAEMKQISGAAHERHRGVRVLQIVSEYRPTPRHNNIDADDLASPTPDTLVDKVKEMLHLVNAVPGNGVMSKLPSHSKQVL